MSTHLSVQRPPEVALPPEAHAGSREEREQRLVGVLGSCGPGGKGSEAGGKLGEGQGFQQPLQARHVLRGRCPPVALLVNGRASAAATPRQQVGRTGEGPPREEKDGAGDAVRLDEGGRGHLS